MSQAVRRLATGRNDVDLILGGGLMPGSTIVVAGPPGSGKTVFAHQICFSNATVERPALYYTTWSEPHAKLFRNLSQFAFFDQQAIGERLDVLHLPAIVEQRGDFQDVADELLRATVQRQPSIVVIDSSKALHGMVREGQLRRVFYELASRVGQTDTVLVLVGEYTPAEIEEGPEFAVADGIVQLGNEQRGLDDRRWIRVIKMRGSANLPGRHSVSIDRTGFNAYPRLELLVPETVAAEQGRASLGEAGLDEITGGGLPRGDATMLLGPSGVGKTVLALSFVAHGARRGEAGLYLSFQETAAELVAKADTLGWPEIGKAVAAKRLTISHLRPVDLDLNRVGILLRDHLLAQGPSRVVVDSIAELDLGGWEADRYLSYLWAAVRLIGGHGATGIFTQEIATLGPETPSTRLSFVFQNVLVMRFLEHQSAIQRVITAFKMRDTAHEVDLTRFEIGEHGIKTLERISGVSGLLGWSVLRTEGH